MVTLIECQICDGPYSMMREHCPYCGARRIFGGVNDQIRHIIRRNVDGWYDSEPAHYDVEIVRAVRTNLAFNFIQR